MDESHMQRALDLARASIRSGGGPFGAVVVRDGVVVAEGQNRVVASADPTAHAEVCAIRSACGELGTHALSGCELYSSCEPCPMCLGAIHWARIERVYYAATRNDAAAAGFDDELLYRELGLPIEARKLPLMRVLADEGARVFDDWRDAPDVTAY